MMADAGIVAASGPDHERRILSVCLSDPEKARGRLDELSPGMFSAPVYRRTWAAMVALHERGERPALCAVIQELRRGGDLGAFGPDGPESVLSLVGVQAHAGDLADLQEPIARLREAQQKREALATARRFPSAAEEFAEEWSQPAPPLIPTGIATLDEKLEGGLLAASVTVLVAATGRGKSGFAMQLGRAWLQQGRRVFYLHTEMTRRQVLARFIAPVVGRPWRDLALEDPTRSGALIQTAGQLLPNLTRHYWQRSGESLIRLIELYRKQIDEAPMAFIIDHLTDLARGHGTADMRYATQRAIAELKEIAERFDVPVLAVAQTARGAENPRPGTAKREGRSWEGAAKDAGEVETDASAVFYLQSKPCPKNGSAEALLHVAKSRGSPADIVIPLRFEGALGRFTDEILYSADAADLLETLRRLRSEGGLIGINKLQAEMHWGGRRVQAALAVLQSRGDITRTSSGACLAGVRAQP
jgi:replicative DNA helicase